MNGYELVLTIFLIKENVYKEDLIMRDLNVDRCVEELSNRRDYYSSSVRKIFVCRERSYDG